MRIAFSIQLIRFLEADNYDRDFFFFAMDHFLEFRGIYIDSFRVGLRLSLRARVNYPDIYIYIFFLDKMGHHFLLVRSSGETGWMLL